MKNLYILFFSLISTVSFAQNPDLFNNDWYLSYLTIDGITYLPPSNSEAPNVPLNIDEGIVYSIQTSVCNQGSGVISFNGPNSFTFDFFGITLMLCDVPENMAFEGQYFGQFFTAGTADVYTYEIVYLGNNASLTITSSNNDMAVYSNQVMATTDFKKNLFNIYPNPVSDVLNIQFPDGAIDNTTFEIYNNIGARCMRQPLDSHTINVSQLPAGVYFIQINKDGITSTQKFIKT